MIIGKKAEQAIIEACAEKRFLPAKIEFMEKSAFYGPNLTLWVKDAIGRPLAGWVQFRLTTTCRNVLNLNIWVLIIRSIVR